MKPYKYEPHHFNWFIRCVGKRACGICGLLPLNNSFTRWAVAKGCNCTDHPDYDAQRRNGKAMHTATWAFRLARQMRRQRDRLISAYRCPVCRRWHVGSHAANDRPRKRIKEVES